MEKERLEQLKITGKFYSVEVSNNQTDGTQSYEFIFRKPDTNDFSRFIKESSNNSYNAMKNLAISTIVEEQKDELIEVTTVLPGLFIPIVNKLLELLGVSADVIIKKL